MEELDARNSNPEIFDVAKGRNIRLPNPRPKSGDTIIEQACVVTEDSNGNPLAIFLTKTRTPSRGLEPEVIRTELSSYDITSAEAKASKEFAWPIGNSVDWSLHPASSGKFSLITAAPGTTLDHVAFFDATTLQLKSQTRPDDQPYDRLETYPTGVNYGGYSLMTSRQVGSGYVKDMHFFDSDGVEVGEFRNVGPYMVTQFGFLMEHRPGTDAIPEERRPGVFYFDFRSKRVVGPVAPYHDFGDRSFNTWSQASRYTYGDLMLLQGTDTEQGQYLSILDLGSGKVVFDLDRTKVAGLRLETAFLGDRYLYLTKLDRRSVVDYQTNEEVATEWALRPVFKLPRGWALLRLGHESESHSLAANSICINVYWTTCSRGQYIHPITDEYIASGGGGGAYAGPWY